MMRSSRRATIGVLAAWLAAAALACGSAPASTPRAACSVQPCPADSGARDGSRARDGHSADTTALADRAAPVADASAPAADAPLAPYTHEKVTPQQVKAWLDQGTPLTVLDVREPSEYASGHLPGARNLAWTSGVLKRQHGSLPRDRPLVVYCQTGNRSQAAATFLAAQGFRPVYDMGGISSWKAAGYPVE